MCCSSAEPYAFTLCVPIVELNNRVYQWFGDRAMVFCRCVDWMAPKARQFGAPLGYSLGKSIACGAWPCESSQSRNASPVLEGQ